MPKWATILTVVFSGIVALMSVLVYIKSFKLATKDDIKEVKESIREIRLGIKSTNYRIDRHLEGHTLMLNARDK